MSRNIRAADLAGAAEGLYIPEHATDIIVLEMSNCSVLQRIVNPSYSIDGLGLRCSPVAHYSVLNDIQVGDFNDGQWNGETWEPDNPFRDGTVRLCQSVPLKKKFSRQEAIELCGQWEKVQNGYETSIGAELRNHTERYGMRILAASASKYNQGNAAGEFSHDIQLGDVTNPILVGKNGTSALDLLSNMEQALQETGVTCGGNALKIVGSPAFYSQVRREQSVMGAGCCLKDNPAVTGMIHPMLGMEVYSSINMPTYKAADGRTIQYVLMVDPTNIAAPLTVDYIEWQTILNDIYLIGNYRFDVAALSGRSIAVAAIVMEKNNG